jgi:hypothetical protein
MTHKEILQLAIFHVTALNCSHSYDNFTILFTLYSRDRFLFPPGSVWTGIAEYFTKNHNTDA